MRQLVIMYINSISVVIVDFGQDVYTFNENDGYGAVEVTINRNIAQDLLVGVIGGLFIHYSGNYTYYFLNIFHRTRSQSTIY